MGINGEPYQSGEMTSVDGLSQSWGDVYRSTEQGDPEVAQSWLAPEQGDVSDVL